MVQAFVCFRSCLANRLYLRAQQNLENVCNDIIERWHFRMLNDDLRNVRYQQAIENAIRPHQDNEDFRVLDIGTGTGLLAIYAAQAGCTTVVAVDDSQPMFLLAGHVIEKNDYSDHIDLMELYSTLLEPDIVGGRFDLIVTETLDSGAFGEGILQTLIHAKEELLKENGKILPDSVQLFIAGYRSTQMAMDHVCLNENFTDMVYLKGCSLVSDTSEPYDTENVRLVSDFKIVTSRELAFSCNFNDLNDMKSILSGAKEEVVKMKLIDDVGYLDGFAMWFDVDVDDENRISSSPSHRSCWDTVVFRLSHRYTLAATQPELSVTVSCPDGRLTLCHDYDYTGNVVSVGQDMIRFINDTEHLDQLEHEFFSAGKRISASNRANYGNVMDFSPFPYVAICLLKEKRARKMFCDRSVQVFVEFVAKQNALPLEQIVFLDNPADALTVAEMFDIIILSPLNTLGCVNSSQVSNYGHLQENKLTPGGRMLPHQIEVWGELVQSHYLTEVCSVTNPKMDELGIQAAINKFATYHHMNLQTFPHTKRSASFLCAEMRLSDELFERSISVPGTSTGRLESDGILYYFQIRLTVGAKALSTRRLVSHIRRACLLWDPKQIPPTDFKRLANPMTVRYVQQHGVIFFSL